jgi:hypothetical protein
MTAVSAGALLIKLLVLTGLVLSLPACVNSVRWWRVGTCLVLYDNSDESRKLLVAGQQCDVKREDLPAGHGTSN